MVLIASQTAPLSRSKEGLTAFIFSTGKKIDDKEIAAKCRLLSFLDANRNLVITM